MTQLTSYAQTAEFFAKARNKEAGRPLGPSGWRLHKIGDDYRVVLHDVPVGRILPNDTLVMETDDPLHGMVSVMQHVLPITVMRRSKGHYRLHIRLRGIQSNDLKAYGLTDWLELKSKGLRLYKGLTIDLIKREPVGYREPVQVVDTDKRKVWLSQSRKIKRILKTIAKMGGFHSRIDQLQENRWTYQSLFTANKADIQIIIDAMLNDNIEPLIQRMAETFKKHSYYELTVTEMEGIIDRVISSNSIALHTALGVIEQQ